MPTATARMLTSFEPGAPAAGGTIPLSVPELRGREAEYLAECIGSGWVSSVGPFVDRFEKAVGDYVGSPRAIALVNGTSALHLALLVAGVQAGDEVLVSDLTFIASANAVRYAGAWPVFIGAEARYWQIDPERVRDFLESECELCDGGAWNRRTGRRIRAIIVVHILGHPVNLDPLLELAQRYGIELIEDAAEAIGAEYRGRRVGTIGAVSAFSFNGNKVITCGGGGMLVTAHDAWADRAKYLSTQAKDDPVEYVHDSLGYNYRLTSLQAAVGLAQMERLDLLLAAKRRVAERYAATLAEIPGITLMPEAPWARAIFWLYTVLIAPAQFGCGSRDLLRELATRGIQARPLWQPMHQSRSLADCQSFGCEESARLHREALSLPSSAGLTEEDQQRVIDAIRAVHVHR